MERKKVLFVSWFIFTIIFYSLYAGVAQADRLIINGSSQMSTGGSQTLSVSSGCGGPYRWSLSGGGYLSGTSGASVSYTAPSANPNCSLVPTICAEDSKGQKACINIAVSTNSLIGFDYCTDPPKPYAYKIKVGCVEGGVHKCAPGNYHCCQYDIYDCLGKQITNYTWGCTVVSGGTCCGASTCDLQKSCDSQPQFVDNRTSIDISNGCCPAPLLPAPPPSIIKECGPACDLKIEKFNVLSAVVDQNGSVTFGGKITSPEPFKWKITIDGNVIGSGNSSDVGATWSLKNESFKKDESKKYTAILMATSDNNSSCARSDSKEFTITAREKDCKMELTIESSVNLSSGNLSHSQSLFSVPNSTLMSDLTLYYNSTDAYNGVLGAGWTHNYNVYLSTGTTDDFYVLADGRGGSISLYKNGDTYTSDISAYPKLQKNVDETFSLTYKNGTIFSFDAQGRLTSMSDRNGNAVALSYNSNGNLISIIDPAGKTIYLSYDLSNRISSINDPNNNNYYFTYSVGNLTAVSSNNSLGTQTWRYTYDAKAFMLTKTDPQGNLVQYEYDADYRLSKTTDPQGNVRTISYDSDINATTITEKDGGVWVYRYDPVMGALKSKTDPSGGTVSYEYDLNRNLLRKIEADGTATTYAYDDNGNMISVTDQMNNATSYTYNDQNLITSITDSMGRKTLYSYDAKGNILSSTDPSGAMTQYAYDSKGNMTSITGPNGSVTTMSYDQNNNLASIAEPGGQTTTQAYDNNGNMIGQTDAAGNKTTFQYNSLNQLIAVTDSAGLTTRYTYDANGNKLSSTDANGNVTTYDYNYKNQLIQTADPAGYKTTFVYGAGGCSSCGGGTDKLSVVTDANYHSTTYQYDQNGRLVKETDPLGNSTFYSYDAKGNMISRTKPDGHVITYAYDDLNRLVSRVYPNNTSDAFFYDQAGNMTAATNQNSAYYYSYDAGNRVTGTTSYNLSRIFNIGYQYDSAGNKTAMALPDAKTITYEYSASNLLTKITTDLGHYTFAYDSLNRRIKRTLPNDTYTVYTYDSLSRLTGMTHKNAFNKTVDSFSYTYDNAGNRLTRVDGNKTISYIYDQLYRLTKANPKSNNKLVQLLDDILKHNTEAYSYDPVGNRLTGPKTTDSSVYDSGNELLTYAGKPNKGIQYEYDVNGNLVKKTETIQGNAKVISTYTYDDENRLINVSIQRGDHVKEVSFSYDPFGRRISKTVQREDLDDDNNILDKLLKKLDCPRTAYYVYDDQNIIAEYDDNGKQTAFYVHGPNIDEPLSAEIRNQRIYYHADGLGSITSLTNPMGQKVQEYNYDSFGNIKSTPFWIKQPYTYTGRELDYETSLYYYRARYYDSKAGRFITKDPIGFGGGDYNLYTYVANDSINKKDPLGLFIWSGNWCGPYWTGGKKETYTPGHKYARPDNALDICCKIHDICYYKCRKNFSCDMEKRALCMTKCDRDLANCTEYNGYKYSDYLLWWWMNYNTDPDPGSNEGNCCKKK